MSICTTRIKPRPPEADIAIVFLPLLFVFRLLQALPHATAAFPYLLLRGAAGPAAVVHRFSILLLLN